MPIRRYLRGGFLTRGGRSRGHWAESPRDGGTRFTQLRNTCSRTGPTTACLELFWRFRVVTMSCGCASRAPGIRLIKASGSRVYTESPSRNTRCLTTEYYIAVHVKHPPFLTCRSGSGYFMGLHGSDFRIGRLRSGSCSWAGLHPSSINSNWAARWATCHITRKYRCYPTRCHRSPFGL